MDYSGMTQKEIVMCVLERGDILDRSIAMYDYGICELPARITELRAKGIPILKRNKSVFTRYNVETTVAEYYLEK